MPSGRRPATGRVAPRSPATASPFRFRRATPTNTNDLTAGTVFFDITFLGNNYIINGNAIGLSDGIAPDNGNNNRINADLEPTAPPVAGRLVLLLGAHAGREHRHRRQRGHDPGSDGAGGDQGSGAVTMGDITVFSANNTYTGSTTVNGRAQVDGSQPQTNVQVGPSGFAGSSGSGTVGSVTTTGFFAAQVSPGAGFGGGTGILTTGGAGISVSATTPPTRPAQRTGRGHRSRPGGGERTVTIGSSVNLNMSLGYSPSNGQVLRLIDNDGIDPVSGTFSGLPEGQTVTMNASDFQISYVGGTGNDVTLTVTAAAKTWTGAVNGLWSVAGNWQGGVPGPGDPLVFPNGASNLTNSNDLPTRDVYKLMLFTGNGYVINGNAIALSDGIPQDNGNNNRINADVQATAPTRWAVRSAARG